MIEKNFLVGFFRSGDFGWEVQTNRRKATNGGLAICFSGCDDNQTSSDTSV